MNNDRAVESTALFIYNKSICYKEITMYTASKFKDNVYHHLGNIKQTSVLEYDEVHCNYRFVKGIYRNNLYDHVLSKKLSTFKIGNKFFSKYAYLPIFRDDIVNYLLQNKNNIVLHSGQRHLNSSQGLVINFLVPIISKGLDSSFTEYVFGHKGKLKIEHDMTDDGGSKKGTEVDFTITEESGKLHIFEAKYTEVSFGKASIRLGNLENDLNKYRAKWYGTSYGVINSSNRLVKYSLTSGFFKNIKCDKYNLRNFKDKSDKSFNYFDNYQLIRNLYNTHFILNGNSIIKRKKIGTINVLISSRHLTHYNEIRKFNNNLKDKYLVKINFLEDICDKAIQFSQIINNDKLAKHYQQFKEVFLELVVSNK